MGEVNLRWRFRIEAAMPHISDDAHDFLHHGFPAHGKTRLKALANGVLVRKILPDQSLVDDQHGGRILIVPCCEFAPAREWNPHRLEIARTHRLNLASWPIARISRLSVNLEPRDGGVSAQRQVGGRADSAHARLRFDSLRSLAEEGDGLLRRISITRQIEVESQN